MKKNYGLQNDKENINLAVGDDKAWITIQTAEGFEARELNLQYNNEGLGVISADKVKLMGFSCNYDGGSESEVYVENGVFGVKTDKESQPHPVQRALKRIEELNHITDVRIDEEFKATDLNMTENRLTITIDYYGK